MKYLFIFFSILFTSKTALNAQFNVRIVVTTIATKQEDDIYVAGNFNNWNPKDENYKLKPFAGGRKAIVLKDISAGTYVFKLTRGSWEKVECTADGLDITDRKIEVIGDEVINCDVLGWKDNYPKKAKPYTASPQVKIIDTAFGMPNLNRTRRIWVYLPKSYASSSKTYPVLYMHDGQNLFNEQTAPFGEWGVDECLDSLQKISGKECIVVGIDHGSDRRISEYNPYDFTDKKNVKDGEGKLYLEFLTNHLKPFIDNKYRTKKDQPNTYIAGSSLGGLISFYAILKHPNTFGGAGIFSPSFWINPLTAKDALNFNNPLPIKMFFYAGGKESNTMVSDMNKIADIIEQKQNYKVLRVVNPIAEHNEKAWRKEFSNFYLWITK
ncbi:MAG: alpha/beta hydrolase [Chitinophagaceae bacterium]